MPAFRRVASLGIALASLLVTRAEAQAAPCGRVRFVTVYDSHGLTAFGDRLDAWLLAQKDAELESYTLGGASTEWLLTAKVSRRGYHYHSCDKSPIQARVRLPERKLRAPAIDELLAPPGTYEKQVVLVGLGSNMPGEPSLQVGNVEQTVRRIRSRPNTVCIWIGPPSMRKWSPAFGDKVYAMLHAGIKAAGDDPKATPACHLVDSRKLSAYPDGGDGWHYGFFPAGIAAATKWADGVTGEVEKILRASRPTPAPMAKNEASTRQPPFLTPSP
ncbi:SGNH/GDSL hydrolase family protein [Polyangium mundeleinium]|uniref:SGNH/GDSL hydrolase family protein n=1 Tax=Polyangium mundeleinium TaxID=2995306 RepID=A0ABT5ENN6_9BACT|nr:SGNH/GDSL hydrolase family protein [Polyangium mundeleinium]MDC0743458.1 SGNH/GDSL hydrolase family protein [Polyangium mundeleinium]